MRASPTVRLLTIPLVITPVVLGLAIYVSTRDWAHLRRQYELGHDLTWPPGGKPGPRPAAIEMAERVFASVVALAEVAAVTALLFAVIVLASRAAHRRRRQRATQRWELRLGRDDLANPYRVQEMFEGIAGAIGVRWYERLWRGPEHFALEIARLPDASIRFLVAAPRYVDAHRYDGAAIERGRRDKLIPCAVQPRDVAIIHDVARYKFITGPQLRELWWPIATVQAADRRLLKLFRAGYIDRFRPVSRPGTGSFPWTYCLGEAGHRLLQHADLLAENRRYRQRLIYDFGHVLHELQLNAWVLAYRRALGDDFLEWEGETTIGPPHGLKPGERLDDDWSAEGLNDPRARPVCPDAILQVAGDDPSAPARLLLIEYDRTRRLDKNYEKFRRYDSFLNWWWQRTHLADRGGAPFVLFICQDEQHRDDFIAAADRELTGHRWHPDIEPERYQYVGRERTLFANEVDGHDGRLEARRLPSFPRGHRSRSEVARRVRIAPARAPEAALASVNEQRAA